VGHSQHLQVAFQDLPTRRRRESHKVHKLVLETFVGPRPDGKLGLHRDDDHNNNAVSNLYWGSGSDNQYDAVRNGKHANSVKRRCIRGHKLSGGNLVVTTQKDGSVHRNCRECNNMHYRNYRLRKKEKALR